MQTSKQPQWNKEITVTCACGNTFVTGSTIQAIRVELCSKCHPLFTGQQKFVDTLGQVDRFVKKTAVSKAKQEERKIILEARQSKMADKKKTDKPSLKDLLMQARKSAAS